MKNLLFATAFVALLISCSKNEKNETENSCPVVDKNLVPAAVKTGFQAKYPSDSVITWFKKDSIGYCAYFIQLPSVKKLAEFSNAGVFISEEIDHPQEGNHEDTTSTGHNHVGGCECEIPE
jgi:hypothetical protein